MFSIDLASLTTLNLPGVQSDPRKEAIRRVLMDDLIKIKLFGMCTVAAATLAYLLTLSVAAYLAIGLGGVAVLHVLAFRWAVRYWSPNARPASRKAAPAVYRSRPRSGRPLYDPGLAV